jgi:hypothetical protein
MLRNANEMLPTPGWAKTRVVWLTTAPRSESCNTRAWVESAIGVLGW